MKIFKPCLLTLTSLLILSLLNSGCTEKKVLPIILHTQTVTPLIDDRPNLEVTQVNEYVPSTESEVKTIWIDPKISGHPFLQSLNILPSSQAEKKESSYERIETQPQVTGESTIIYEDYFVLTVPFINQTNNVEFEKLEKIWAQDTENNEQILWIYPADEKPLERIFNGKPGNQVVSFNEKPNVCEVNNCWHLVNFQKTDPEWRIIATDEQSPLNPNFDSSEYRLVDRLYLNNIGDPPNEMESPFFVEKETNFDPTLLTSVLMTGTTALVRNTASQIEQFGLDFPLKNMRWLFDSIDIIHISNEVPFYSQCPPAIPIRKEMRFCSNPGYIEVLNLMGVDVVELTGNHLLDWGPEAFLETLSIYEENGIQTYGGGRTIVEAEKPIIIEHNGNKIAFLGCNLPGPENNWVSDDRPGSLACNLDELAETISTLREQGINPIFTFQHNEFNTFRATQQMREDFWQMANAGAVIVSGSQAHYPQGIDFVNSTFIHYGLGNFLFDQMYTYWGMATIDVHYFYENRYLNTHQYPIINENFGQPRLMNAEETKLLLDKIYSNSFYYLAENP